MIFWLVLNLEISYRVNMISWRVLLSLRGFLWRLYFCMVKYLNFHNPSLIKRFFDVKGKATVWHTPCFSWGAFRMHTMTTQRNLMRILKIFCSLQHSMATILDATSKAMSTLCAQSKLLCMYKWHVLPPPNKTQCYIHISVSSLS
jgi:hypothetical protein